MHMDASPFQRDRTGTPRARSWALSSNGENCAHKTIDAPSGASISVFYRSLPRVRGRAVEGATYAKRGAARSLRIPPIATRPMLNSARVGAIGVFFGKGARPLFPVAPCPLRSAWVGLYGGRNPLWLEGDTRSIFLSLVLDQSGEDSVDIVSVFLCEDLAHRSSVAHNFVGPHSYSPSINSSGVHITGSASPCSSATRVIFPRMVALAIWRQFHVSR
jgi:hypothetical protein